MLDRLAGHPRTLRALGTGHGVVHLDLDGFVVSVTAPSVPRLPNGVEVAALRTPLGVAWDPAAPPAWDPVVTPPADGIATARAVANANWPSTRRPIGTGPLEGAGDRLVGRGPGLTPEGDDVLCGMAIGLRALGPGAGLPADEIDRLVALVVPAELAGRTGALSATLLRLAATGAAPEPAHRLIGGPDREAALADLHRLGASTGRAIGAGIEAAARYVLRVAAPG